MLYHSICSNNLTDVFFSIFEDIVTNPSYTFVKMVVQFLILQNTMRILLPLSLRSTRRNNFSHDIIINNLMVDKIVSRPGEPFWTKHAMLPPFWSRMYGIIWCTLTPKVTLIRITLWGFYDTGQKLPEAYSLYGISCFLTRTLKIWNPWDLWLLYHKACWFIVGSLAYLNVIIKATMCQQISSFKY